MERYEAYKDSGVEWIGEIPESWTVQRFRWTLKRQNRQPLESDEIVTCFRDGEVTLRKNRREDGFTMSDKEIGYQHICAGDFVIHGMDGFAGAMGISDSDGKASPVLMAFRPIGSQDLRYINYLLRLYAWRNVFLALSTTIRVRSCDLNWAKVAPLPLTLPSYKEQQAIADYLDAKTAEIDALVADCEREIELLQEYRKAVISEAVTKGLDLDAPMKDSGVEWIGEIPNGWGLPKLGSLTVKIGSGKTPRGGADVYADEGVPFLRSQNVYDTGLILDNVVYLNDEIDEEMASTRVMHSDVLLNITGGSIGRCCVYELDTHANVNQHVCIIRLSSQALPKFIQYYWNSSLGSTTIDMYQTGANREGMNFEQIASARIPLPSISEQHRIAGYLDAKTAEIDSIINSKQSMADKLREYRRALISEAVAGKFKVPGV